MRGFLAERRGMNGFVGDAGAYYVKALTVVSSCGLRVAMYVVGG